MATSFTGYKPPVVGAAPDLQKVAAGMQLPQNMTVTPTPLLSQGVDFKSLSADHQNAYEQAYQYGMMNRDAIIAALQPGGALSNSFGFSNSLDVAGLTPEQVMALTNGRGVNQSLQNTQATMDAITMAPQIRQLMARRADMNYETGAHLLSQQNAQNLQAQIANAGQLGHLATTEAGFQNADHLQDQNLQQQWAQTLEHSASRMAEAKMHIASQERIASQHMAMERAKLELESRKLKILQAQNPGMDIGTVQNPAMLTQYNAMLMQLGALDPKTKELNFGNVDPKHRSLLWQVYMQREAAKGLPWNQVYTVPKTAQGDIGYGQLILGRDGWHGIYADKNGQRNVTNVPVIPYRSAMPKTAGAVSTNSLYAPATETYGD